MPASQTHLGTVADTNWLVHGLGDQTGDGRADLLWRHDTSGALFLWTMNGTTLTAQTYLGAVVPDYGIVGTADYTGDGKSDILWRHQATGELVAVADERCDARRGHLGGDHRTRSTRSWLQVT